MPLRTEIAADGSPVDTLTPVFVVGSPRSGTTLVGQILDTHSRVAVYLETNYYPLFRPILHLYGDLRRRGNLRRLVADFVRSTRVQGVRPPSVDALEDALVSPTFEDVLAAFLRMYAAERGKCRGGEKTPLHFRYVPDILDGFPGSPVVFLMRDPRDTIRSMRKTFGADIEQAARVWNEAYASYAGSSDQVHLVRYEELVRDPASVVRGACAHIREEYEPTMLQFFEHIPEHILAIPHLDVGPITGPVVETAVGKFNDMPREDVRRIEAACSAGMEAMGYPFSLGTPSPARPSPEVWPRGARLVYERLRYYGLNRERWRRAAFRWSVLARLYTRYILTLEPLRRWPHSSREDSDSSQPHPRARRDRSSVNDPTTEERTQT